MCSLVCACLPECGICWSQFVCLCRWKSLCGRQSVNLNWQPRLSGAGRDSRREAPKSDSRLYYRVVFEVVCIHVYKGPVGRGEIHRGRRQEQNHSGKKNRVFIFWSKPKVLYLDTMGRREICGEKCQNQTHAWTGWFFLGSVSLCTKTKWGGERFNEKGAKSTLNPSFSYFSN